MTEIGARRYRQPPLQRRALQQAEEPTRDLTPRIDAVEFGNYLPTFQASISDDFEDITTERRQYFAVSGTPGTDTVFWDYWDDDYDRNFFDPFIAPSGPDIGRIGAVELLVPGLYAVRATIDWNTENFDLAGSFGTWIAANYDDSGMKYIPMDLTSQIVGSWALSDFRVLWPAYTGAENFVEITVTHDNAAEEPLYIPGAFLGYWGFPPHLTIAYLGGLGIPEQYYFDV